MSAHMKDISGQRFNMLVAIEVAGVARDKSILWLCRCDCGSTRVLGGSQLRRGIIYSCGCANRRSAAKYKHGGTGTKAYQAWVDMRRRCDDSRRHAFVDYGGRGISYDAAWGDFSMFIADMGVPAEGQTLDRINNDEGYSKANCRWADMRTQCRNRRSSRRITCGEHTRTIAEWSEVTGIKRTTIAYRIQHGWPTEKALGERHG